MQKQYFVAIKGSMQMLVMSEGLLLNSKSIEMGGEEGGLQKFAKCVAVFIPFNGKFVTFCSLGQT